MRRIAPWPPRIRPSIAPTDSTACRRIALDPRTRGTAGTQEGAICMRYNNWVRAMVATGLILLAGCLHDDDDAGVTPPPPPPPPPPPAQVVGNDVILEWNAL